MQLNTLYDPRDHCEFASQEALEDYSDLNQAQFLTPPRAWLHNLVRESKLLVDAFRHLHPEATQSYTCWNTYLNARPTNEGTRIDYILLTQGLLPYLQDCSNRMDFMGSDHCPVEARFSFAEAPLGRRLEAGVKPPSLATDHWHKLKQTSLKDLLKRSEDSSSLTKRGLSLTADVQREEKTKKPRTVQQMPLTAFFKSPKANPKVSTDSPSDSLEKVPTEDSQPTMTAAFNQPGKEVLQAWAQLLKPPPRPQCYHKEDCKEFLTKVKGRNQGRWFYACARPGLTKKGVKSESGEMTVGDERCHFFQWKSASSSSSFSKKT